MAQDKFSGFNLKHGRHFFFQQSMYHVKIAEHSAGYFTESPAASDPYILFKIDKYRISRFTDKTVDHTKRFPCPGFIIKIKKIKDIAKIQSPPVIRQQVIGFLFFAERYLFPEQGHFIITII